MSFKIEIIYQDEDIICINKPAGALSIPDRYDPSKKNLQGYLTKKFGKIWAVHRLDRDTSGVMIWAKNEIAHKRLNLQFEDRQVKKTYEAIVEGAPHPESGRIDNKLIYQTSGKGQVSTTKKGKPSQTDWTVLTRFNGFAHLALTPLTGRTHQLRIHMTDIGHPIIADGLYGNHKALFASDIKIKKFRRSKDFEERPLINRQALHAKKIAFLHPTKNEQIEIEAMLPKDMKATLHQLNKWKKML